ncbi:hypothetical protein PHLCEN_2v1742 [Hermanssonia centrifuga]|uniref:Uncharacterized protein n=1 Tax=Hermanssonia centrifuga TaxID=98765 RepID=A0A2R6RW28_9APHY|nr:hypothetical protein PHLCEN_2v1742 [Hermanssonia centrifuga]
MPVKREAVDPITLLLSPPPNETAEERVIRLQKEAEARKISENIDEQLRRESAALKKRNVLRMLLLGQSESGKSTTLKNIQLIQAPEAWQAERASWRIVIQLNLVRAVNTILDILSSEVPATPARAYDSWSMSPSVNLSLATADDSQWHDDPDFPLSTSPPSSPPLKPSVLPLSFTAAYAALRLRLTPLRRIEADLKLLLGAASDEVTEASLNGDHSTMVATPFDSGAYPLTHSPSRRPREFCVRSHDTWKDSVLKKTSTKTSPRRASLDMDANGVIAGCREDIWFLWKDEVIREALRRQKIVLEDSAE